MHLKKLELTGFKSFADRTPLDFAPGLNAVVGPNGSGKSNIADALRWVLGEQSAKQLRGGKMEDVIFAGTAHRKPLGYAEIIMRLDNTDSALPLPFKEITVTRRVYRSGESEYAINNETCRLKDIQMLFMDTGIGRDGYSIIGQGRIDEILSLRSEDRRLVFEEAAGISKYKTRRGEAQSKLERQRQNRARVDDIIDELDTQLEPLSVQSEEARRYLQLRDEYKSVHINVCLGEIQKITGELAQIETSLENARTQSQIEEEQLIESRKSGEELKARASVADAKYRRATEALLDTTMEIEQKQGENKLLESRIAQYHTDIARLENEADKRETQLTAKKEEIEKETAAKTSTQQELDALNQELTRQQEISAKLESTMREGSAAMDALSQALMTAMNDSTDSRAALLEAESAYNRLEEDKERLNAELLRHNSKTEENKLACQEAEAALSSCNEELTAVNKTLEAYTSAYAQLQTQANEAEKSLRQTTETLTARRGRLRALSALESQHEGYYRSVKAVLTKKATDPAFSGICGAVGELVGVDKKYEIAIETALGGAAQNIVTKTEQDAKKAIEMLKSTKEGRATFLPLTAVKGRNIDQSRLANQPGFISLAADLVEYSPQYAPVISQLLGDIVIMDTLDNALALNKKFNYSHKIVTLEGERLSPGGAITGGSLARQSTGLIGRGHQLEKLKAEVETLERTLEEQTTNHCEYSEKATATREALDRAKEHAASLQLTRQSQQENLTHQEAIQKNLAQTTVQYNEENDKIMTRLAESNATIHAAQAELTRREEAAQKARTDLENYQREIEQSRQEHTEEADELTELKVELSRRTEWLAQSEKTIKRLEKEIKALQEEKQQILYERDINITELEKTTVLLETAKKDLEKYQVLLTAAREELSTGEREKTAMDEAISQAEAKERTQMDATALLNRELTRLEMRKEHLDSTSLRLHDEIWEEYGLTYQTALPFKQEGLNETGLKRRGQELKGELSQMTNVNIGAIEAYKEIKTRYDFLTVQRQDIMEAEASLNELIESLTAQMEGQFKEKFTEIAAHFQDVFKEMFNGGKADLRLADAENILESGIEIIAQPPGKALQNLMLLSGGERALTAIALLFAILRLKPSPFCVLDEIESALDDANVSRFARFIKEYSAGTQFIIITHRKGTMEAADNLYGVTMEEQGVSKLVSVRFVDNVISAT